MKQEGLCGCFHLFRFLCALFVERNQVAQQNMLLHLLSERVRSFLHIIIGSVSFIVRLEL